MIGAAAGVAETLQDSLRQENIHECCIDSGLAERRGLPKVETDTIVGVYGSCEPPFHLAPIYISVLAWIMYGKFAGGT